MMALFLKDGDSRLEEVSDFEVQTMDGNGRVVNLDWYRNSTFNKVFENLREKHLKGIEISVLDYGDQLQATVTVNDSSFKYHYLVLADL